MRNAATKRNKISHVHIQAKDNSTAPPNEKVKVDAKTDTKTNAQVQVLDSGVPKNSNTKLLFTPGPLTTSDAVRNAMAAEDLGSRDTAFIKVQDSIRKGLLALAEVEATHECVLMQGSGTFAVEATIGCAIPRGGKALIVANGAYGERMGIICTRLGIEHRVLSLPWTSTPNPADVAAELAEHPADVVLMVHHETTCGIVNDVEAIGAVLQKGEVFVVDAMSGFGGIPLDLTKAGVDFMVSSANKCIPGVPGFAYAIAKRESLLATEGNARSLALDLLAQWKGFNKNGVCVMRCMCVM